VGYIRSVVEHLVLDYGIDPNRIYGIGHSNGAMLTQRVMCETGLYAAAIPVSGPLNLDHADCQAAHGKRILAIHGEQDANVPVAGGRGTKGISRAVYNSEEHSRQSFESAGASYDLLVLKGADHRLDHVTQAIQLSEGRSLAEKAADYFGLIHDGY
jgi:poly(3-hydroxybutyrate) depolymerase